MITPMKKVTVVCLDKDRDATLVRLGEVGVLHVTATKAAESPQLDSAQTRLQLALSAQSVLGKIKAAQQDTPPSRPDSENLVDETFRLLGRKKELSENLAALQAKIAATGPLGDFDPGLVNRLAGRGIYVKLFRSASGAPENIDKTLVFRLGREKPGTLYAAVSREPVREIPGEIALPDTRLSELLEQQKRIEQDIARCDSSLAGLARHTGILGPHIEYLRQTGALIGAGLAVSGAGRVAYLRGFCPAVSVDKLKKAAAEFGWGLLVEEPAVEDNVPVLIKTPRWARPIESLFSFIKILPGYREIDASVSFLVFMTLFFGMIVGDAGYGLVFLVATLLARRKWKNASPQPFRLIMIFSVSAIIWGALTGVWFGIPKLPGVLAALRLDWLTEDNNVILLCLLIGAIHMSLAHAWKMVTILNSWQAISQAGWICITWSLFFTAKWLLLGHALPAWFAYLFATGLLAALVFMTPLRQMKTQWINHVMFPLSLMSGLGDTLSYLRLFALGIAAVKLEGAFYAIADAIGWDSLGKIIGVALILVAGHALNMVLGILSVVVHAIRLNALEFSMHLGLEWSGSPYAPLVVKRNPPQNMEE